MELNSINQNQDFEKVVAESKGKIQEEMISKQPKKRGRPSKQQGTSINSSGPTASSVNSTASVQNSVLGPQPFPDISQQMKIPIQFVSRIPAIKYQIAELAFDDQEAIAVAQSINEILKAFIPDVEKMSPKTAAVLMAGMTIGTISFNKYMIFTDVMEARRAIKKPEPVKEQQEINKENEVKNPINAQDLFKR